MALAQDNLDAFAVCYTKAVDRLHKVSSFAQFRSRASTDRRLAYHRSRVLRSVRILQGTLSMAVSEIASITTVLPTFRCVSKS